MNLSSEPLGLATSERVGLLAAIATMVSTILLVLTGMQSLLEIKLTEIGGLDVRIYHVATLVAFSSLLCINGLLIYFFMRRNSELNRSLAHHKVMLEQANQMISPQMRLFNSITQVFDRMDQISNRSVRRVDSFLSGSYSNNDFKSRYKEDLLYVVDQTRGIFERLTGSNCSVCVKYCINLEDDNEDPATISTLMRDSISYEKRKFIDGDGANKRYSLYSNTAFEEIVSDHTDEISFICNDLRKYDEDIGYQNSNKHWRKYYNACLVVPIKIPSQDIIDGLYGFLCIDNMHGGFDRQSCLPIAKTIANFIFSDMLYYYMEIVPESVEEDDGEFGDQIDERNAGGELEKKEDSASKSEKPA